MASPVYDSVSAGSAGEVVAQKSYTVHRWTLTENSVGKFVVFPGGTLTWGPIANAANNFDSGTVHMRVSFTGLTDVDDVLTGNTMILGQSAVSEPGSAGGAKAALYLGPCMIAPEVFGAGASVNIIIEAEVFARP